MNEITKEINQCTSIIEVLTSMLEKLRVTPGLYSLQYEVEKTLEKNLKRKEQLKKQLTCQHGPTGDLYTGHDSHYDYYENTCTKCGYILSKYRV